MDPEYDLHLELYIDFVTVWFEVYNSWQVYLEVLIVVFVCGIAGVTHNSHSGRESNYIM